MTGCIRAVEMSLLGFGIERFDTNGMVILGLGRQREFFPPIIFELSSSTRLSIAFQVTLNSLDSARSTIGCRD